MADKSHLEEIEQQAAMFALGALPASEAELFRQRLAAGCPLCRAEAEECTAATEALLLSAPGVTPPPGLKARLLDSVRESEPQPGAPVEGILVRAAETPWKASPYPGVELRFLLEKRTMLVRMAPNTSIPAHPHAAAEQCLVLEGSITSGGVTAHAGDFTYMPAGSAHDHIRSEDGALFLITYS